MKRSLFLLVLILGVGLFLLIRPKSGTTPEKSPLIVFCAAGLKKPIEVIAAQYLAETGTEVQLQYGGTATLLSAIRAANRGDLFVAADNAGIEDGRKLQLLREAIPLVRQRPLLAVLKGNPKGLHSLADLKLNGVRLALANPEAAAIGRVTKAVLGAEYEALQNLATVTKPTVTEIANDLSLGAVDAAILWDSTIAQFPKLEAIEVPPLSKRTEDASVAVLASCKQTQEALRFARYLAAPEKGGTVFQSMGFTPVPGDHWAQTPEMILYSGGVNRPAIEGLLKEFSEREGVQVTTVFNGCGVLCATMKTMGDATSPKFPDAYFACDLCFIPPVAKFFPTTLILTETEIGLVVKKGNPKELHRLEDLARPGLRVGLCNAEQSTLGFMTRGMLQSLKQSEAVAKNVAVEVPTADFLINQMRAGGLDAAVVYRVNAVPQSEHLEFIPIEHPGAKASQPFSVRAETPNFQLASRLLEYFQAHRSRFESAGFVWRGDQLAMESARIEIPAWLRPNQPERK